MKNETAAQQSNGQFLSRRTLDGTTLLGKMCLVPCLLLALRWSASLCLCSVRKWVHVKLLESTRRRVARGRDKLRSVFERVRGA